MFIEFKSLRFKNLLSYGGNETSVDFSKGLNVIVGKNGQGKSSILDALSFCLYGAPYRKIKIAELVNRKIQKKLFTSCDCTVNGDAYRITRTISPNKLEILENDSPLELLSSNKLNQEEIDRILGIDHKMFRQVICLAINYNKPFLSLSAPDKRDIIEAIFNLKIFGNMTSLLKKEQTSLKVDIAVNEKTIVMMEQNLKNQNKQIKDLKKTSENFETKKKEDLEKAQESLEKHQLEIKEAEESIKSIQEKIDETEIPDITSFENLIFDIKQEVASCNSEIKRNRKIISTLEDEATCPLCDNPLDDEHKESHLEKLQKLIDESNSKKVELEAQGKDLSVELKTANSLKTSVKNYETEIGKKEYFIEVREGLVNQDTMQIQQIEDRELELDLKTLKKEFEDEKKSYSELYKRADLVSNQFDMNKSIIEILSEKGIKAFFFGKLLPVLNKKVNSYIRKFNLPVTISFDELMQETIKNTTRGEAISYMSLSEGEKKRVDISILLSFIETTKAISNWNSNILFFDELLDNATDPEGLDQIVNSIKDMTEENKSLCAYIISHRVQGLDSSIFNKKLEIKKTNNFSEIVEIFE